MLSEKEVDLQGLTNELNRASKIDTLDFNKLLRSRAPYFLANIGKATMLDLVLFISAIGMRVSRSMSGSKDLIRSNITMTVFQEVAEQLCQRKMIESGKHT